MTEQLSTLHRRRITKPSRVLSAVADLFEEQPRRFTKGTMFRKANGSDTSKVRGGIARVCSLGGIVLFSADATTEAVARRYVGNGIMTINDGRQGRRRAIARLREAAASARAAGR